ITSPSAALAARRGFQLLLVAFDLGREFVLSNLQVVAGLEIHPENRCVLKVTGQPQSGICVDTTALAHDVSDLRDRHAQVQSQLVHAEAQRLHEFLVQNLASIHWLQFLPHLLSSLSLTIALGTILLLTK